MSSATDAFNYMMLEVSLLRLSLERLAGGQDQDGCEIDAGYEYGKAAAVALRASLQRDADRIQRLFNAREADEVKAGTTAHVYINGLGAVLPAERLRVSRIKEMLGVQPELGLRRFNFNTNCWVAYPDETEIYPYDGADFQSYEL